MNSKESLENQIGQEELTWDPYEGLSLDAAEDAVEGQLSAKPEQMTRQETQQALGVAAMAGMLESGMTEEELKEVTERESEEQPEEGVDTVIVRARQALGEEQFESLAYEMMWSAEVNLPEVTMKKFRESAGVALMDAGELWQAVLAESKRRRFDPVDEYVEQAKFYYSMSLKDLKRALGAGKIERTDKSGNCLKSDLSLSGDYFADGEWHSGFADSRGEEAREVTLVLDGSILNEEDFVALRNNPTVDTIDLKKYCLGFVTDFGTLTGQRVNQMVRKSDFYEIPVYRESDVDGSGWATSMYPADYLRYYAREHSEAMDNIRKNQNEIYENVDREGLREKIEKFSRKMKRGGMEKMILQYDGKLEAKKQREKLGQDLMKYYAEALGVEEMPEVVWTYDLETRRRGEHHFGGDKESSVVTLNWARLEDEGMRGVVRTLGHEMRHLYQHVLVEKWKESPEDLTGEDQRLAELFDLNFRDYIKSNDDPYGYREQLVEADSQTFAMACEGVFARAYREVNRPINRMRRGAAAVKRGAAEVRRKAEGLTYKGKRVAKKESGKVKK